jgi:hypothetical protein
VPLSEREQRLLDQIERTLSVEDPKLASVLRGAHRHRSSRLRVIRGVAIFASGLVLLVLGVGITSLSSTTGFLWLSAIGFLLMLGGAVLAVVSIGPSRTSGPTRPGTSHRHWFGGRPEKRLRRPFEQG